MNDAAATLTLRSTGAGSKALDVAGHAIVESSADSNDNIRIAHRPVRVRRTVHAQHVHREG